MCDKNNERECEGINALASFNISTPQHRTEFFITVGEVYSMRVTCFGLRNPLVSRGL